MHRDRMHAMGAMWGGGMFRGDPLMAVTDGQGRDQHHHHRDERHRRELQPGRAHSSHVAPYGGQYDPFSFMSSMMSNMHNMMGNAFHQMVRNICVAVGQILINRTSQ